MPRRMPTPPHKTNLQVAQAAVVAAQEKANAANAAVASAQSAYDAANKEYRDAASKRDAAKTAYEQASRPKPTRRRSTTDSSRSVSRSAASGRRPAPLRTPRKRLTTLLMPRLRLLSSRLQT